VEGAVQLFTQLLKLANDVGLFPEEIHPCTKEHLGNFPQAFSHATVVQAALAIQDAKPECTMT
jgi:GH15 family glucan-1,4-alpha-glucosidase